ncbi:hypothetical protein [Pseudovibrio sp. Ad26]|uniref:hypothetical protein n=1 Tax=Pseudovibrio sp. Ad26 TaxID=989410 RepID=UPI0007AE957F|nr:hypothetical protein [Pseudovibrio sp. Ad26]KZL13687.1 hypothetical protein PsAD26_01799 [Pseudovibrio sp. Ad26]
MTYNETAVSPVVSGPRMIAPMQMDCLLVGMPNQKANWAKLGLNYDDLLSGKSAITTEVSPNYALETGAHLHFTVPKALRHGTQNEEGMMSYPDLPNRWLVTRILSTSSAAKPALTSWIIESDYLSEVTSQTEAQWLLNTAVSSKDTPQLVAKGLGRAMPLAEWNADPLSNAADITASAPGSIRWAAAYSGTQNVLSFHDPLTNYDTENVTVGYMLIGWYQPVTQDPFAGVSQKSTAEDAEALWQQIMTEFAWTLAGGETEAKQDWEKWLAAKYPSSATTEWIYPSQMLCNSVYLNLPWQGKDHDYTPGSSGVTDLALSVGQSSSQALAALLAANTASETTASTAVTSTQKNDLLMSVFGNFPADTYSSTVNFDATAQATTFSPTPGGIQWVVRPANANNAAPGTLPASSSAISVNLTNDQVSLLVDLNQSQAEVDQISEYIADLNWRIFAVAYLEEQAKTADSNGFDASPYTTALAAFKSEVDDQNTKLANATKSVNDHKGQLETSVGSTFQVLQSPLSQFMSPNDPAVIVAGKGIAGQTLTAAASATQKTTLDVRVTGETLSKFTFSWTSDYSSNPISGSVSASTLFSDLGITSSSLLPVEYQWLLAEAILLNPGNAQYIASLIASEAGQELTASELEAFGNAIITALQTIYPTSGSDEDHDPVSNAPQYFTGVAPSAVGVSLSYSAPWIPLVLDWKANWYPDTSQSLGSTGSGPFELSGQTILNGTAFGVFSARLQNFIKPSPQFSKLTAEEQSFLTDAEATGTGFDVLIQTMSGFEEAFLSRKQEMSMLTSDDPDIRQAILSASSAVPTDTELYAPLRAGRFEFTGVYIADAFGQVLNVIDDGETTNPVVTIPPALHSDSGANFAALEPALTQPAKLDLMLMSAATFNGSEETSVSVPVNSASASTPIIGWLLPNRLEQSMMVFEADGTPAGTVRSIYSENSAGLRWESAPGQPISLGTPPTVQNPLFEDMLTGLLATQLSESDAALEGLLQLAALNSWAMSAKGGQPLNGNLQEMLGTPIAVVSARLALTQQGPLILDPVDLTEASLPASPVQGYQTTCSIGDFELAASGVLGSYVNGDFSQLITARNYQQELTNASAESVKQTLTRSTTEATGTYINSGADIPVTVSSTQAPAYVDLVLLVDPRGQIPVTSTRLPANWAQLTPQMIAPALQNMSANFRVGPILTPVDAISLPLPGGTQGQWQWVEVKGTGWEVTSHLLTPDTSPQLGSAPAVIRDGWLSMPNVEK